MSIFPDNLRIIIYKERQSFAIRIDVSRPMSSLKSASRVFVSMCVFYVSECVSFSQTLRTYDSQYFFLLKARIELTRMRTEKHERHSECTYSE